MSKSKADPVFKGNIKGLLERLSPFKVEICEERELERSPMVGEVSHVIKLYGPNSLFVEVARITVVDNIPGTNLRIHFPQSNKCQHYIHDMALNEDQSIQMVEKALKRHKLTREEGAAYMAGIWLASGGEHIKALQQVRKMSEPVKERG